MADRCRWCGREGYWPRICKSTRDMEDRRDPVCDAELLKVGGGEYTHSQMRSITKYAAAKWLKHFTGK